MRRKSFRTSNYHECQRGIPMDKTWKGKGFFRGPGIPLQFGEPNEDMQFSVLDADTSINIFMSEKLDGRSPNQASPTETGMSLTRDQAKELNAWLNVWIATHD